MANSQRDAADALVQALSGTNCSAYDFFRVVRLFQAAHPELPLIGTSKTPQDDPLRFGQHPALAFAPGTLEELVPGEPPKLFVNFFGLFGPNGPLPLHLTQFAIRRQLGQRGEETPNGPAAAQIAAKDHAMADFFDIFHHRLISLFFRAWATCQPPVDLDREGRQRFLFFLAAMTGEANADLDDENFGNHDIVPLKAKVYYAGRLACPVRNAEGLGAILQDYFAVNVAVQEFVGRWMDLPAEDWFRMGQSRDSGRLGKNVFVGSRIWLEHLAFRVRLGPMTLENYCRFLPVGRNDEVVRRKSAYERLRGWVVDYCGAELVWDLQLVLLASEVPAICLGRAGQLGWTTWLKSHPFVRDADDLVLAAGRMRHFYG